MVRKSAAIAALGFALLADSAARAMTLSGNANIVELLEQSQDIVVGRVASVVDGLDERGVPYTEVKIEVSESIRGNLKGTTTFRQFGLLKPRPMPDGRTMMPAPPGFPTYVPGEDIVLMLRPSARWTGFRMPAGVKGGKFKVGAGRLENDDENRGLFVNVNLEKGLATANEKRMMNAGGPANRDTFLSFLRKAVREHWVESGRMSRAAAKPASPGSGR
jgi:hypothetical protein